MHVSTQPFIADTWVVNRSSFFQTISRCLCILLITGPCVTVMLNFDNYKLDSPSSRTAPFTCFYRFFFYQIYYCILLHIFHLLFFLCFLTIEWKWSYSIDKIQLLAQVHAILLITVQWYTVMTNFDYFGATWSHMLGSRPSVWSYTSPLHCCTQTRQPFLFYRMISLVLVFLLSVGPCVTTVWTKWNWSTLRMHVETTLLIDATGNKFKSRHFKQYYLNNYVNQRRNWINKTGCIRVVRRDTQKCCTTHNQTK